MLENKRGRQLYIYTPDYVLFDLETTGISCMTDEVIEISAVKVRNGQVTDEFSELVNPGRPIPYAASRVNHITDQMVEDAPQFAQVLEQFLAFAEKDVLVGHNIGSFDMQFLYRDCERYLGQILANDYIDTLSLSKTVFPSWRHRRLSDLAEYYGISTVGAHRALADCRMNQKVYENLGKEMEALNRKGTDAIKICPKCQMPMKKRSGRYGEFWGCTGFPKCRYTENL